MVDGNADMWKKLWTWWTQKSKRDLLLETLDEANVYEEWDAAAFQLDECMNYDMWYAPLVQLACTKQSLHHVG